jgi:hypothetical protein
LQYVPAIEDMVIGVVLDKYLYAMEVERERVKEKVKEGLGGRARMFY